MEEVWLTIEEAIEKHKRKYVVKQLTVLYCLLGISFFIYELNSKNIRQYNSKEFADVSLIDSSSISLNKNTIIEVTSDFLKDNERLVSLKGEAFFNVKKMPKKPFRINCQGAEVIVLGTAFNVRNIAKDSLIEVVVSSGKVQLTAGRQVIELAKNEKGIFNRNQNTLYKLKSKNLNDLAWQTKKLEFKNASMTDVVQTIEKLFDLKITVTNPAIRNCRITSSFKFRNLEDVLTIIETTTNTRFRKVNNQINVEGNGCKD